MDALSVAAMRLPAKSAPKKRADNSSASWASRPAVASRNCSASTAASIDRCRMLQSASRRRVGTRPTGRESSQNAEKRLAFQWARRSSSGVAG